MASDVDDNNLLSQLYKWTSRQDENYVTDAFAHLLRHLREHQPSDVIHILSRLTGDRLRVVTEDISEVAITTQVTTERGRPDLEIQPWITLSMLRRRRSQTLATGS